MHHSLGFFRRHGLRRLYSALLLAASFAIHAEAPGRGPPGEFYFPEVDRNTIAVLDTASDTLTRRIPVGPVATRPAVMAANRDASKLYVDNFGLLPATVSVIDRRNHSLKTLIVGSTPLGAFSSLDGKEIYLPELGFTVEVIDTATDTIVRRLKFAEIPVGAISGPDGSMYVSFAGGSIGVYDPRTGAQIRPPIWSGGLAPFWFSFNKSNDKLYVDTVNTIGVIDLASWKLVKTIGTRQGQPHRLSDPGAFTSTLSPDGSKLYVTVFGDTGVRILDTASDTIVGSIPTSGSTIGLSFSGDGRRGYISDLGPSSAALKTPLGEALLFGDLVTIGLLGPGQLIVFDPADDRIIDRIPTGPGPGLGVWVPPARP